MPQQVLGGGRVEVTVTPYQSDRCATWCTPPIPERVWSVDRMASILSRERLAQGRRGAPPRRGRRRRSLTKAQPRKMIPSRVRRWILTAERWSVNSYGVAVVPSFRDPSQRVDGDAPVARHPGRPARPIRDPGRRALPLGPGSSLRCGRGDEEGRVPANPRSRPGDQRACFNMWPFSCSISPNFLT